MLKNYKNRMFLSPFTKKAKKKKKKGESEEVVTVKNCSEVVKPEHNKGIIRIPKERR
jgi:hypothetical protein